MKKNECEYAGKLLKKYLRGHLFKPQKIRIDRHLKSCVVCRSQFEALKRAEETKLLLKDIAPEEGIVSRVREGLSSMARLKKILYRPLWIAGIVLAAAAVYHFVVTPTQFDIELDSIVKTMPSGTAPTAVAPSTMVVKEAGPAAVTQPAAAPAPAVEPLMITITISRESGKAAIRRINEVMRGHGSLFKKKFSDEVREISGSLTATELLTFLDRIEPAGKVGYSHKRFASFPSAQPIPFAMKLKFSLPAADNTAPANPAQTPVKAGAPAPAPPAEEPAPQPAQ